MSWGEVKLEDIFEIVRGGSPRPIDAYITEEDDGYNWISIKDASNSEKYIEKTQLKIKKEGLKKSRLVKSGDFLLTNSMSFGRPYIMKTTGCIHDGWLALSGDEKRVDSDYFYHLLSSDTLHRKFSSLAKGAVVKNLNINLVKSVEIPLPYPDDPEKSLKEQKRIAAILDKADGIRRKRQQATQLADDFLRSVFLDMFGDPVTNPKGFKASRVDSLCTIVRGSSPRPKGDSRYYGPGIPRLMVADLTRDGQYVTPRIDSLTEAGAKKSRFTKAGTVVMAVSGNVGLTSILEVDACIHDGFIAFNSLKQAVVKPAFFQELMMFLKSTHSSRQAGAIFKNLTTSQIKEMEIPLPSVEQQGKYLSISNRLRAMKSRGNNEGLFESLSQKAFKGEL